jgi:hypothetical protein
MFPLVFRIRIHRFRKFLGLMGPLVRDADSDPNPSVMRQKPLFLLFCDFFMSFYHRRMMELYFHKVISKKN